MSINVPQEWCILMVDAKWREIKLDSRLFVMMVTKILISAVWQ